MKYSYHKQVNVFARKPPAPAILSILTYLDIYHPRTHECAYSTTGLEAGTFSCPDATDMPSPSLVREEKYIYAYYNSIEYDDNGDHVI